MAWKNTSGGSLCGDLCEAIIGAVVLGGLFLLLMALSS